MSRIDKQLSIPHEGSAPIPPLQSGSGTRINWPDINFPFLYRVAHFSLAELHGRLKGFTLQIYLSFLIVVGVLQVNVLSTIIQVSCKYAPTINICFTILSKLSSIPSLDLFVFLPLAGYVFHLGYQGVAKRGDTEAIIIRYRIYQTGLCVFWFIFSIVPAGCINGWVRIGQLARQRSPGADFCIFLTVLEALGFTAAGVLGFIGLIRIASVLAILASESAFTVRANSYSCCSCVGKVSDGIHPRIGFVDCERP